MPSSTGLKALDVTVEAELGILSGDEEGGSSAPVVESKYTDPGRAEEFIRRSGCDSLAVSVGTCHGLVKMKPGPDGKLPGLRFDILEHIRTNCPGFPLVLHGASNIAPEYVEMINEHGGHIEQTAGIPDDQIRPFIRGSRIPVDDNQVLSPEVFNER